MEKEPGNIYLWKSLLRNLKFRDPLNRGPCVLEALDSLYDDLWQIYKLIRRQEISNWQKFLNLKEFYDKIDEELGNQLQGEHASELFRTRKLYLDVKSKIYTSCKTEKITSAVFKRGFRDDGQLEKARKKAENWWDENIYQKFTKMQRAIKNKPARIAFGSKKNPPKGTMAVIFEEISEESHMVKYLGKGAYELINPYYRRVTENWNFGQTFENRKPTYYLCQIREGTGLMSIGKKLKKLFRLE